MIHLKHLPIIITGCLLLNSAAIADNATVVPTITYQQGKYRGQAPDWTKINWDSLPPVQQPGYLKVPKEYVSEFGYDPSRSWNAGQKSDSVVMLGDVDDEFGFGDFTLDDIDKITNSTNPKDKEPKLNDIGFVKWQTTASLVKAIPSLGDLQVSEVKPILKLFGESDYLPSSCSSSTISECLQSNPEAGERPLGDIDLDKYSTSSIPGLQETPLRKFKEWQRTYINQVPGLSKVPFSQMPNPINSGTTVVGIASTVFGKSEKGDPSVGNGYYVSGSVVRGDVTVSKACEAGKECSYLELGDFAGQYGLLYGKRWASGSSQQVKGGYGFLAGVNGGKEPTGRLVFSPSFKVAMIGANESKGTADFGLFFRMCVRPPFSQKTCTPYFIGPIPWISAKENDLVFVGVGK